MHGNLFLEEPVADLEKLEEDFVNIVKEKIKSDPENMLMMNKVRIGHNYLASSCRSHEDPQNQACNVMLTSLNNFCFSCVIWNL